MIVVPTPQVRDTFAGDDSTHHPERDPDAALVKSCCNGNHTSFRQLYQRHQQKVRSILFSLCGGEILDDLVQDVFVRAWKGLPKFRQNAKFSTWLYRIAWNVGSDQRRNYARQRSQIQALIQLSPTQTEAPNVMHLHYQQLVQHGLAHLSPEHRMVIVLHDLEALPQQEIAQILGIPVGTVKSRLFNARADVRRFLQQAGMTL